MSRRILTPLLAIGLFGGGVGAQSAPTMRERQAIQQGRIRTGVRSGQLTRHETAKLERREAAAASRIRRDRIDGGGLTAKERVRIDRMQDRLSRQIHREKHDSQVRPPRQ